ncbi:MAG: T9SS type A sorting domain-containing protein [Balneolaceae bacterium]|nr:T9SS type A sorting domain-containing protein [Balneolaceae bacterium]MBO6547753.1 T9SS type A sorting domain-containing protein [Balneolaceae bacterium]MBO6648264.1 T9SS type A sorting domain-containing protein [Balneolaceae bacterium]
MKKLLILIFLFPVLLPAQEKYFHELKGMEDSTGTTHLFYRMYEKKETTCSVFEQTYQMTQQFNNIYHYSIKSGESKLYLNDYERILPKCDYEFRTVGTFLHPTNDPDSVIVIRGIFGGLYGGYTIGNEFGHDIYLGYSNPLGFFYDSVKKSFVVTTPVEDVVVKHAQFSPRLRRSFQYDPRNPIWDDISSFNEIPDSLFIDFSILGISDYPGTYYGAKDSNFVFAQDHGKTLIDWFGTEFYVEESTVIGSQNNSYLLFELKNKYTEELRLIKLMDWQGKFFMRFDLAKILDLSEYSSYRDTLYYSKNDSLFVNTKYEPFEQPDDLFMDLFNNEITGLYKKPNSDILYVLTTDELFELNTETKAVTSLKKLPVSNEVPREIPSSAKLYQNYPNPFNPSTTISFKLNKPTEVTLTVFDALGRTISVLVNGRRISGVHEVSFDASNLSSGIYFYRLETGAFSETKRLTLIK